VSKPSSSTAQALADRSRVRLTELGASVREGYFVCPLCLRLLPDTEASQGHYPAKKLPGPHRSELLCIGCNSFIGQAYENDAIDFLTRIHKVEVGPAEGGRIFGRAKVQKKAGTIEIDMVSGAKGKRGVLQRAVDEVRQRSQVPNELDFRLSLPADEFARRAILAWSYLEWFFYAGYRYVASSGAELVRRLILDPDLPLPNGSYFQHGSVELPLAAPRPILVIRAEKVQSINDIQEVIGLGTEWGVSVSVFPFANDQDGRCWNRLEQLLAEDELRTIRRWPLRKMLSIPLIEKGLRAEMVIGHNDNRHVIAQDLSAAELEELSGGRSPRQLTPPRQARRSRRLSPSQETKFTAVASPKFGGPSRVCRWIGCRLDFFDEPRLLAQLRRGHQPIGDMTVDLPATNGSTVPRRESGRSK
jgi:hypothetical protein